MALHTPPFLKLVQDIIGYFLIFHLICVSGLFDENQPVFLRSWHMVIQVAEELGWISVREIIIGSHKKNTSMSNLFSLRKVTVFRWENKGRSFCFFPFRMNKGTETKGPSPNFL